MPDVEYRTDTPVTTAQFTALLNASSLGERRPVDDPDCIAGMLDNADLTVSAWAGGRLVGVARSVTDFHYACYLSDLAVDRAWQGRGIGRRLLALTRDGLGPRCRVFLIAAPGADSYYEHIGLTRQPRCWVLTRDDALSS
ncbi:hypothetical protein KBTX_03225 [wastewater metagenome]|uniref:N-acetyltransferase domain-containing protein n=2 Tax=unclassified sequences TaxID=12908 RepID=A0A5B8RHD7_9ZZZZ|nr:MULTISPECIES: GNAT family N-acetyltransferase [Arhodomonas]MCS4504795.1 GNAT family N-acetyltransferase [Arhodomonas aquaeolei]QEA06884.1 hypothetical protein KBTEX_03225 [uncultured organism]